MLAGLGVLVAVAALAGGVPADASAAGEPGATALASASLSPRQKAALLVVSGLPAPRRVGGVIVFSGDRSDPRPRDALVYADQEGGVVKRYPHLPPFGPAVGFRSRTAAFESGRDTGRALRRVGVHVDLAPVLDTRDGPLGSRHYRRSAFGVAFARGLGAGRSTGLTTDSGLPVTGRVRAKDLAPFGQAIKAGIPCVMVGHAIYPSLGRRPASLEPATYRRLRRLGFDGVALTDSLTPLGPGTARWARQAIRAGADLVLVQEAGRVRAVIRALVRMARTGALDSRVERVIAWRRSLGLRPVPR
ncbi:MAG: glycoside hydrolase family 3 N-terminal domain-containing protein [Gaiellales bacterium]